MGTETRRQFKLTIELDNAAFEESEGAEIARILINIAAKVKNEQKLRIDEKVRDVNGNTCGKVGVVTHAIHYAL